MMVLRLNTLMVLAVAADECMCQLFPVRGGDGQLKFAANDDGSCIAEKLFRAPRLEAGEELIVGDTNVMDRVESITAKALQTREQLDARDAELEQALQDTLEYLEAKSLGLQTNLTQTQEERAAALLEEIQRIESQEASDAETFRSSIESLSESLDAPPRYSLALAKTPAAAIAATSSPSSPRPSPMALMRAAASSAAAVFMDAEPFASGNTVSPPSNQPGFSLSARAWQPSGVKLTTNAKGPV